MAELDGRRIAAVLTADTAVQSRTGLAAELNGHLHKFADADRIQTGERIGLVDLILVVGGQELAGIVAREAERHLRQIVRAEAEELRLFGDLVGSKSCTRDLDHRADFILEVDARSLDHFVCSLDDDILHELHFLDLAGERDHDLGDDVPFGMTCLDGDRSLDDRIGLHHGDLRIGDAQTAAAVTHHRVELVQVGDDLLDLCDRLALRLGERLDVRLLGRDELMQRRVEEADGDGVAAQRFKQTFKVCLLHRLDLGESRFALFDRLRADHFAEGVDAAFAKEHVLGTAQADALRAERGGLLCILRGVCIGTDAQSLILVGEIHDTAEIAAVGICGNGRNEAVVDVAGGAVQRNAVAFMVDLAGEGELLVLLIHLDVAAAGDAAGAHAARNDGRVGGLAAADGQDTLRILHTFDVLRGGLEADEDDLFALFALFNGVFGGEDDGTCSGARGSRNTLADDVLFVSLFQGIGIELRVQEHIERLRIDLHESFLLGDHALVDEVAGDLDRRGSGTLAVTRLQHVEFAVLDGELHILHVAVMIFEDLADFLELLVHIREDVCHLRNGHRGADACDDVFALGVGQELAHEALFAGRGVTRERDARAAVVAHVAERHHLHVDRGTPAVRDVVVHTVDVCAGVVPRTEHRLDRAEELFLRVGGEVGTDLRLVLRLELLGELFQVVGGQLDVLRDALLFLHLIDELLEIFFADFHNDVRIHLDEAAIAVVCPTGVAGFGGERLHDFLVEAEVEDGVHHARHGSARTRTNGDEQRVFLVAEFFAADLFHLVDVVHDLGLDLGIDLAAVLIILRAGLGGDGEALRNGKTDVGHFREVRALTAEQLAHLRVALRKEVAILLCHRKFFLLIRFRNF